MLPKPTRYCTRNLPFAPVASMFALLLASLTAYCGTVSLNNGNYYTTFRDMYFEGKTSLALNRTYNSKTSFKGLFGWGWGTEYESTILPCGDGSLVLAEFGGGRELHYSPASVNQEWLNNSIQQLMRSIPDGHKTVAGMTIESYEHRLQTDADFRCEQWRRTYRKEKLQSPVLPEGTVLKTIDLGYGELEKTTRGYHVNTEVGTLNAFEEFDDLGRLTTTSYGGSAIRLDYDDAAHKIKVRDNYGHTVTLQLRNDGFVASAVDQSGRKASFDYSDSGDLIYAQDATGWSSKYGYNPDGRHNLISVVNSDGTSENINYFGKDLYESVKSITDTYGNETSFQYVIKNGDLDYEVIIEVRRKTHELIAQLSYEFFYAAPTTTQGLRIQRIKKTVGSNVTDTTYDAMCLLPETEQDWHGKTTFQYDDRCRPLRRVTPTESDKVDYKGKAAAPASYRKQSQGDASIGWHADYEYNKNGLLSGARYARDGGKVGALRLRRDSAGRVSGISQGAQMLRLIYDETGHLGNIEYVGKGTLQLNFAPDGGLLGTKVVAAQQTIATGALEASVSELLSRWSELLAPAGFVLYSGSDAPQKAWNLAAPEQACGCVEY